MIVELCLTSAKANQFEPVTFANTTLKMCYEAVGAQQLIASGGHYYVKYFPRVKCGKTLM